VDVYSRQTVDHSSRRFGYPVPPEEAIRTASQQLQPDDSSLKRKRRHFGAVAWPGLQASMRGVFAKIAAKRLQGAACNDTSRPHE
jgi:hypothetical protein